MLYGCKGNIITASLSQRNIFIRLPDQTEAVTPNTRALPPPFLEASICVRQLIRSCACLFNDYMTSCHVHQSTNCHPNC